MLLVHLRSLLILGILSTQRVEAIALQGPPSLHSLGFGLSSHYRQEPDLQREQRYRADLFWLRRLYSCVRLCLQWENHLALAPDLQRRSGAVEVRDNVYHFFSGLRLSYVYLLRYGISGGPLIDWNETYTQLKIGQQEREVFRRWAWGWQGQLSIQYAFNPRWEVMSFLSYQTRSKEQKADTAFGLSLVLNMDVPRPALNAVPTRPVAQLDAAYENDL